MFAAPQQDMYGAAPQQDMYGAAPADYGAPSSEPDMFGAPSGGMDAGYGDQN